MRYFMPLRFGVVLSLAIVALTLIACGEDSETVRVTDRYTLDMLGAGVSLTEERCDSARMGQLLYVGDSSSIYYCTGKVWKKINGSDGRDGRDGKDGVDGTDGKRGKYGTSGNECSIDGFSEGFVLGCGATKAVVRYNFELPDTCSIKLVADSSYVLACGDENVTLIQGPQGAQGASCVQTDIGEGRVKLVCGNDSVTTYKAQCGETPFDPDGSQFCYGDTLVERCNMHIYDIQKQFCYGDTLVNLCAGNAYELNVQFCYNDSLVDFCGGKAYDLKAKFCYNDSLVNLCGGKSYDIKQQFCSGGTLVDLCGGKTYDLKAKFCYNDSLVNLCGGKVYDVKEQFCSGGTLVDLCGGETYDLKVKFCYNDSLVNLCGGKEYDVKLQFCYNNTLINLCGSETYDPKVQFCHNDELFDFCAGRSYDADKERCSDGTLIPRCPAEIEDYHFCDERNGKVYRFTVIGGATWMAQNLDYRVPNSFCNNSRRNDSLYCEGEQVAGKRYTPIGRYYPWSVAMVRSEAECGTGHICPELTYPHQGVCPNGWHLPDTTEWRALIKVMGKNAIAYWDQSVRLTYGVGENLFGLSVIPTGIVHVNFSNGKFSGGDITNSASADIWSSTESNRDDAFLYFLYTDGSFNGMVQKLSYRKSMFARTVRCVRD